VQVDYVIVQPGNSLWRIARRVLGEGMSYVHIYEANQAQIRDPDLIYPGQVFEIPSGIDAAG
jgi:nucleoid-associated protein YgaU